MYKLFGVIALFMGGSLYSQNIKGWVFETVNGQETPLPQVNVYWSGTTVGTSSDTQGQFTIEPNAHTNLLVFSYVGYTPDTIKVALNQRVELELKTANVLNEVEVSERQSSQVIQRKDPVLTQNLTGEVFHRAACCNLSESFETNATVDVGYADAVTGAKQIKMLGLDGKYVQLQVENLPLFSGLASSYGLMYIPGPWMESIQISKGSASVKNGYRSITGQINSEFKKPNKSDRLFLNIVGNDALGWEANATSAIKLSPKWSTLLAGHVHSNQQKMDNNHDGFVDEPMINRFQLMNRWRYQGVNLGTQFGILALSEDRIGGQTAYQPSTEQLPDTHYGIEIRTKRIEGFWKGGYILPSNPDFSIAMLNHAAFHRHESIYGLKTFDATEHSLFSQLLFEGTLWNRNHRFATGIQYQYQNFDYELNQNLMSLEEQIPGAHMEYTYSTGHVFTLLMGARVDYSSRYGLFATPRIHAKWHWNEQHTVRVSAGKGYRTAHLLIENSYLLANGATLVWDTLPSREEAWNAGLSYIYEFKLFGRNSTLMLDYYRTDFDKQLIIDRESQGIISIYNLDGRSFSNAYQIEYQSEPIKRLDVTLAFRYTDVRTDFKGDLLEVPLVNRYKGLIALSYATNLKKWQFDLNIQWNGNGRLPGYRDIGTQEFPNFWTANFQISKFYRKWSIYAGVENLTGYVQENPILSADQPFSQSFDASQIWGPVHGRKFYLGARFNIAAK